LQNQVLEYI
jgi:hypothetical protein